MFNLNWPPYRIYLKRVYVIVLVNVLSGSLNIVHFISYSRDAILTNTD